MTSEHARKQAIRARMAATGEPYSVAARALDAAEPGPQERSAAAEPASALAELVACAARTLTASSARVEIRSDTEVDRDPEPAPRRRPGLIGRLAGRAAKAAWERVAPDTTPSEAWEMLMHQFGAGFIEPAAGRHLIDFGGYAEVLVDGRRFGGRSGEPLGPRYEQRPHRSRRDDPLDGLRKLQRATAARWAGTDQVRLTTCRVVATTVDDGEFTVWVDDKHVRRFQTVARGSARSSRVATTETVELWDFGVPVDSLDWSRLPAFLTERPA